MNPTRHRTYIQQANRKPRSFEQIKEAMKKENNDNQLEIVDKNDRDLIIALQEMQHNNMDVDLLNPSMEDLLRLAGGEPDMLQLEKKGASAIELRTVLAQRVIIIIFFQIIFISSIYLIFIDTIIISNNCFFHLCNNNNNINNNNNNFIYYFQQLLLHLIYFSAI